MSEGRICLANFHQSWDVIILTQVLRSNRPGCGIIVMIPGRKAAINSDGSARAAEAFSPSSVVGSFVSDALLLKMFVEALAQLVEQGGITAVARVKRRKESVEIEVYCAKS